MAASRRAETATASVSDTTSLRLVLPALAGVAGAYVLWRLATETSTVPPRVVLGVVPIYLLLWIATVLLHARRWQMVLGRLGNALPLTLLARLWLAARAIGSLVPSGTLGGEPVRAQLLVASGIPAARAAGAVALDRSLELAGNMIVGPLCIGGALALGAGSGSAMLITAASALLGLVMLIAIYVRGVQGRPALVPISTPPLMLVPARWRRRIRDHAAHADQAMQEVLAAHPRLVPAGLGVSLLIEGLHLVELTALYAVFALAVPLPLLLLSSMGIGIAHIVPVTAALGTLEASRSVSSVGGVVAPGSRSRSPSGSPRPRHPGRLACLATAPARAGTADGYAADARPRALRGRLASGLVSSACTRVPRRRSRSGARCGTPPSRSRRR
jgi:uncharacterized protein (TIRG00374 family)